jgi:hypothetical protein
MALDVAPVVSAALGRPPSSEAVKSVVSAFNLKATQRITTEYLNPPGGNRYTEAHFAAPGLRLTMQHSISGRYEYEFCSAIQVTPRDLGPIRQTLEADKKIGPFLRMTNYAAIVHDLPPDGDTVNKRGTGALVFPPPNDSIAFELFCSNVVRITISCIYPRERIPGSRLK